MSEQQEVQKATFPLKAILGQKVGMTQIFTESGQKVPVSVIYAGSCMTTQVKTLENDGYTAVQFGTGEVREKSRSKPYLDNFKKKNLTPMRWLKEFTVKNPEKFKVGEQVPVDIFSPGDYVDVSGTSKGKGFAGVMKRHNFHGLPASHGASDKERSPGSSAGGSGAPQRVLKGHRMAGRMGSEWVTSMKLEVVKIDKEQGLILVKGAIPGTDQNLVVIRETTRALKHKRAPVAHPKAAKKASPAAKKPGAPAAAAKPAATAQATAKK